ncbi:twitching motility two-component system response regulator PilH [Fontimonas thermophila]|uniref:Twitching motility two-component system response regulator PilH n=1 Tax=Fontimonas thermophila TaxID=1076937 RepID=A0A1I2JPN8_9GAMM|nr:response regulator [Fontimonas thermophila]SFF54736.1 twitching motility two-component system response regulator PilH [Fontimonas thermophila]
MARVMIVDDSPTDVQNLRGMLQKAGHIVSEATTGEDAIARVRAEKPDVVIMDVVMPGVNGFQATRTLSKDPATAHIPVIVVSSKSQETDRVWALRQGAKEYLVKPVKEADLLAKINIVLGR